MGRPYYYPAAERLLAWSQSDMPANEQVRADAANLAMVVLDFERADRIAEGLPGSPKVRLDGEL